MKFAYLTVAQERANLKARLQALEQNYHDRSTTKAQLLEVLDRVDLPEGDVNQLTDEVEHLQ